LPMQGVPFDRGKGRFFVNLCPFIAGVLEQNRVQSSPCDPELRLAIFGQRNANAASIETEETHALQFNMRRTENFFTHTELV